MIGKTVLHYKILEKLGEGGMGVVYRAEDLKLTRTVALKFLPHGLDAHEPERARFLQEARAAAILNHPNICTIHDIAEHEGQQFIVMEFVDGMTLRDRIAGGKLPRETAVPYAIQIGEALHEAHTHGIVHRDIKAENIMVTKNQVKVMDFGLAKLKGSLKLTKTSSTIGTLAYMAPEQIQGGEADARSDIFSFGVVLFQMLTGRLPFRGEHDAAMMYSILNEEPEPLQKYLPDAPSELLHTVNRALEKVPEERYQTVQDMVIDLRRTRKESTGSVHRPPPPESPGFRVPGKRVKRIAYVIGAALLLVVAALWLIPSKSAGGGMKSLAVLPFTNLQKDPDMDFLGIALADQITGGLSYLKDFNVRASSLVRRYQGQTVDPIAAGRELQVEYVLTGNYLMQGNLIRLSIELIDSRTGALVWRQPSVEADFKDAFKLQDMIAGKVIEGLRVQFSEAERERMQKDVPRDPLAYEYYLRALSYPLTVEGATLAMEMLKKSVELDSTFSPAFTELGYRCRMLGTYQQVGRTYMQDAEHYLSRALSLNGTSLPTLGNLAEAYNELGKTEEAYSLARKGLEINPNDPDCHFALGYVYRYVGLLDKAEREQSRALQLSPGNPRFRGLGVTYFYEGKYDSALKAFDLDPGTPFTWSWKVLVYRRLGRHDLETAFNDSVRSTREANEAQAGEFQVDGENLYWVAMQSGHIGDAAECARALRKAVEMGFFCYPAMASDSDLEPVRPDPRVQEALALARKKHEEFKNKWTSVLP